MKEKASAGESVLSVPEDTSLYFLSSTNCPTRVFSFTPGIVAPGQMTDKMIREIERQPVRYLLWSNRQFPEFGTPVFGEDFDREIGDYLKANYHRVGPLVPVTGSDSDWTAVVWERNETTKLQSFLVAVVRSIGSPLGLGHTLEALLNSATIRLFVGFLMPDRSVASNLFPS